MKITIKWFVTGNTDSFEDSDDILGPNTTMLELKGLIQIRYSYPAKEVGLIYKKLLDNPVRLRDLGIVDQATADQIVITAHVFRDEDTDLEPSNLEDDKIQEFTHEDFALAMAILGKDVPVMPERMKEMRDSAPRSRPQFLNQKAATTAPAPAVTPAPAAPAAPTSGLTAKLDNIYKNFLYGARVPNTEKEFAIQYSGVEEPYEYWDMRLPETPLPCGGNDIALEMFYFGEFKYIDKTKFPVLLQQLVGLKTGYKCEVPRPAREAGCMYPLVAVTIVLDANDAYALSERLFEDFGKPPQKKTQGSGPVQTGAGGGKGGCAQQ